MQGVVYVNGVITAADAAVVPVFDHGFLYGEGVYETLRTYKRAPFLFAEHMARLRRSAGMIALAVPMTDAEMAAAVGSTIDACPGGELYIRILVTRGVGELTYNPKATPQPTLVIITKPLPGFPAANYADGIRVALVGVRRNHPDALNPQIKSNNLLNNAMAAQEAIRLGADEALMRNHDGFIVECSQSNFFVVKDGRLATPPLGDGLLPGITRQFVIDLAREAGIAVEERPLLPVEAQGADEAFITGTTREITPVTKIDDQPVGNGKPGPVTTKLMAMFASRAS
ncbi:MAG: branched-chain-amino acid aminotransferase [Acidobacteria bacterium]|nr:MAG: branched-chain-amino acid aminotransferase [Acidobacteriota bacterium]